MKRITIIGNPMSDNHLYGHRAYGTRVIKYMMAKGKLYKKLVAKTADKPYTPVSGPVSMNIKVYFGDRRKRDIQGHLKCVLDSLIGIFYEDDVQVITLKATKFYDKEFPRTEIVMEEFENE